MVDGVLLLVDASEGPLPQTRFVLRKALAGRLPVILVMNKIDRPDARIPEVLTRSTSCSSTRTPTSRRSSSRSSTRMRGWARRRSTWRRPATSIRPLLDLIVEHIPAPTYTADHPLQAQVANLDASPYLGRLAVCRVREGEVARGTTVAWCRADGDVTRVRLTELLVTEGLERVAAESAGPGEIIAVAGIEGITIGETIADADDPRPLPLIVIDEPSLSVTVAMNTSPLAGRSGSKLTARMIKDRLDRELLGNVSLRVLDTEQPDTWEVQGRGEMQFAVLAEMMRREGFELTIGKPRVVTREVDGRVEEPVERVSIDVPEEYSGVVIQALALRKGRMESMTNHGTGWVRLEHLVPARGLLGSAPSSRPRRVARASCITSSRATSAGRATSRAGPTGR